MISESYLQTKNRIEKIDALIHQALILSESLNPEQDSHLLFKRGELVSLKENVYDPAAIKFLKLNAYDPAMKKLIKYMSLKLKPRLDLIEQATKTFLNDLPKERSAKGMGAWYNPTTWFDNDLENSAIMDVSRGEKAMQYFYDAAIGFPEFQNNFPSFQSLKDFYGIKWHPLVDGLGMSWRLNSDRLSESDVESAMHKLAVAGEGKLPTNLTSYHQALGREAMDETWYETVMFSSIPVLQPLADIGETVLNVGKAGLDIASGTAGTAAFISRYKFLLFPALGLAAYLYFFGLKDPRTLFRG